MSTSDKASSPDRRQQILDAALKVFSTKGFQGATNKDIAEAAGGISPGLIYWYFKDKEDLFLSLIQERAASIYQLTDHPEQLMELPPRQGLTLIGRIYLDTVTGPHFFPVFRILIAEIIRFPQLGEMVYKIAVGRVFNLIRQYLQRQIDVGCLKPHDPAIATRSFIGMLVVHIVAREILRQPEAIAATDEQLITTAVDIFLHGMEQDAETAAE